MKNRTRFAPAFDSLEAKIALSADVPSKTPVTPGEILPTQKPIAPPGMGNPGNTNPTPLPPNAPPLPTGDYPTYDPTEPPPVYV